MKMLPDTSSTDLMRDNVKIYITVEYNHEMMKNTYHAY